MSKSELEQQAREYADAKLKGNSPIWKEAMRRLIIEAYARGWVDRDTLDMKPETQDEFFNRE